MQLRKLVLIVPAAAVFGCLMAVEHELDGIWARALIATIAGGGFAAALIWIQCGRVMRPPEIALFILAALVFGCLMAVRHELLVPWARIAVAAIAGGGFAVAVVWILGRGVKR